MSRLQPGFVVLHARQSLLNSAPRGTDRLRFPFAVSREMSYTASDIEVLSGLEPVRRRPGMYTDTQPSQPSRARSHRQLGRRGARRPRQGNQCHAAQGQLACRWRTTVAACRSTSIPKEKVSGVELILTRLHAGGKFNDKNYEVSGGLHGVGVSVVNALSKQLETWIKRNGKEYNISFKDGKVSSKLEVVGTVGQRNTGTTVRFWPDPKFFDSRQVLRSAAEARAQGQGRAVPGPEDHVRERGDEGEGRVVLHRRSRRLSEGRDRQGRRAAGRAHLREERQREGQRRRVRAGVDAERRTRHRRELRQSDSDRRGRHARQWTARRRRGRGARVLRVPQSRAARHQAHARGHLRSRPASCSRSRSRSRSSPAR